MSAKRKLIYGVGINDGPKGCANKQPIYKRWKMMFERCYYEPFLKRQSSYRGCSVDPEWHHYTTFHDWLIAQPNWENLELDKDLLGSKSYSPETCLLIPKELNNVLISSYSKSGDLPLGVYWETERQKYTAGVSYKGKRIFLGRYTTPELASAAYVSAKKKILLEILAELTDPKVKTALTKYIGEMK